MYFWLWLDITAASIKALPKQHFLAQRAQLHRTQLAHKRFDSRVDLRPFCCINCKGHKLMQF